MSEQEIPPWLREQLSRLQQLQQNLQAILMQKQQIEVETIETTKALEELMKNRTSIIIAHRLSTIREADKIVVLEKGKVIEVGTHSDLMLKDNGLYRYLSELQFES